MSQRYAQCLPLKLLLRRAAHPSPRADWRGHRRIAINMLGVQLKTLWALRPYLIDWKIKYFVWTLKLCDTSDKSWIIYWGDLFTDTTEIPVSCLFLLDNLLITLWKIGLGDCYLLTNQENKAFDLKNNGREEERRPREEWRREFPHVPYTPACRDANLG